jgi:TetR/AcrR family transcriptional repressor of nem operon
MMLSIEKRAMSSRQKILDKAAELIHTRGFNHTSIQDVLDAASVTKSNFYYHFESKEHLAFEVLGERMRRFYAVAIGPSLENKDIDPLKRIDAFFDRLLAIGRSEIGALGCPFGNLAQEISSIHEPLRESLSLFFKACTEALERCFEEGKDVGIFRQGLPSKRLADFVLAQIQGSFLLRKTHKEPRVLEDNLEVLRQVIRQWSA